MFTIRKKHYSSTTLETRKVNSIGIISILKIFHICQVDEQKFEVKLVLLCIFSLKYQSILDEEAQSPYWTAWFFAL